MDDTQEILAKLHSLRNERAEIYKVYGPMQERLMAIYKEEQPLKELLGKAQVARMRAGDPIDWKHLLKTMASDADNTQALLRYFGELLRERFSMYHSGYYPDTMEGVVKVTVERTAESERKNVEGVKFFAALMTPHEPQPPLPKDGPKRILFGVFENSCSEHGVYQLSMLPDLRDITLTITRYHRTSDVAKFKTVEEAIHYIREHHWYGDSDASDV
jgi:hypothetical protein